MKALQSFQKRGRDPHNLTNLFGQKDVRSTGPRRPLLRVSVCRGAFTGPRPAEGEEVCRLFAVRENGDVRFDSRHEVLCRGPRTLRRLLRHPCRLTGSSRNHACGTKGDGGKTAPGVAVAKVAEFFAVLRRGPPGALRACGAHAAGAGRGRRYSWGRTMGLGRRRDPRVGNRREPVAADEVGRKRPRQAVDGFCAAGVAAAGFEARRRDHRAVPRLRHVRLLGHLLRVRRAAGGGEQLLRSWKAAQHSLRHQRDKSDQGCVLRVRRAVVPLVCGKARKTRVVVCRRRFSRVEPGTSAAGDQLGRSPPGARFVRRKCEGWAATSERVQGVSGRLVAKRRIWDRVPDFALAETREPLPAGGCRG
mmetsp:Transcript_22200/g.55952  ORF Transcript_22200/g.55952 Transcript_22200/m.55952 type:complete len:362 (+) Transcript_22200:138-1223(+)